MSGWREEVAWAVGDAVFVLLLLCLMPPVSIGLLASVLGEKELPPHPALSRRIS